jgi:hypothetical protein
MQLSGEQLPAHGHPRIARWMSFYVLVWFVAFLSEQNFFLRNFPILLPVSVTIGVFLYFCLRLRSHIQQSIFGEIGFVYLAFAVAYTAFPAYGFLAHDTPRSWIGVPILESLRPDQDELGLQLWRHVLFIVAVAAGYLLFRGKRTPTLQPVVTLGGAERPIIRFLVVAIIVGAVGLWSLSAPVQEYIDNYTRYDHLSWIGLRGVAICTLLKTGGTFVLLPILFTKYKRYRNFIWCFVLLRTVQEVLGSLGARIDAFIILSAVALLYHSYVKPITLTKAIMAGLALMLLSTTIAPLRLGNFDPSEQSASATFDLGELGAVFMPGFHLYAERSMGTLPPVPWQLLLNDVISIVPLASDKQWNPMYWWAHNYAPESAVPPITLGPIALSALWGGEPGLFVQGLINGILFAFLMRWFAKHGRNWQIVTVYMFCYSTCVMCLKYSILFQLAPLLRNILPMAVIVSLMAKGAGTQRSRVAFTG